MAAKTPTIISASRRTDVPRFYCAWFRHRRRAGFADFRNAFGGAGRASLRDKDVLAFLFWTRLSAPFGPALDELEADGLPYAFHHTITGLPASLEPDVPDRASAIRDFVQLSKRLPSPRCIQWRYDPLVIGGACTADWHRENFRAIAGQLEGHVAVVNTSVIEPYLKVLRRLPDTAVLFRRPAPTRHRTVIRRYPDLPTGGEETNDLLRSLAEIAAEHGMELRACANPELGLPRSICCSRELFEGWGEETADRVADRRTAPSRDACQCLESVDIGMDNTCVGGCRYCYVTTSSASARRNHEAHDPEASSLR